MQKKKNSKNTKTSTAILIATKTQQQQIKSELWWKERNHKTKRFELEEKDSFALFSLFVCV
jgi:hypothetical protein